METQTPVAERPTLTEQHMAQLGHVAMHQFEPFPLTTFANGQTDYIARTKWSDGSMTFKLN
jgi:hypothetical protein